MYLTHNLVCRYSGLYIGQLSFMTTAGAVPYLMEWSELVPLHPVFSLSEPKLLEFTKSEWNRLAQRIDEEEITEDEANILRVTYLAVLHKMECIKQDVPALPPLHIVQATIQKLFALVSWKYFLESKKFSFPTLHISKYNENASFADIDTYLNTCFEIKEDYQSRVSEAEEQEKVRAAERAMKKLNEEWITPTSKRVLWTWIRAHLPEKYQPDAMGWLGTLFLGSNATILEFDKEDIKLAEEMIVASCPAGTGVMFVIRKRLAHMIKVWEQHHESFEIQLDELDSRSGILVNGVQIAIPHPGDKPTVAGKTKGQYAIAIAKWEVAFAAWKKHTEGKGNEQHSEL